MAKNGPRARGSLEHEILSCLAAADRPLTAGEVQAEIGGLAYTTVMTTLARLHAKGALERAKPARAYEYSMVGSTETAHSNMAAHQMLRLLDEESDRAGVLSRFVCELTPEDERILADLLDRTLHPQPSRTAPVRRRAKR
jgi:predicted transcriptional regulator